MNHISSRKQCLLLCVFVMKEYLLNFSCISLKYILLVFSSLLLLTKLNVSDNWKQELSNFHEISESARARASFEKWFYVESRVTAFTGKKNQVKRLLFRWYGTHFRWTGLCGHEIKEFFKICSNHKLEISTTKKEKMFFVVGKVSPIIFCLWVNWKSRIFWWDRIF